MAEHTRTAIRRLSIRGFRSIRAVDLEYFDVQLTGGETVVTRKPRAKAAPHFYENPDLRT